ncbi:MAG: plastocyanin/azurin family copper-binding protein [Actinomycetota bacterium]|nr:plastocyanin/azurin family copper-binding protein [Actinomycetota bacterium]
MKVRTALLVLLLFIGACGDDGSSPDGPTEASVALDDFAFAPATITVTAGEQVTINVSNIGGIQHSWVLLQGGAEVTTGSEVTDAITLAGTADLDPGQSETVTFTAPEAGSYQIVCHIPGHIEAGMVGTLEVDG